MKLHREGSLTIVPIFVGAFITLPHPTKENKTFDVYDSFDMTTAAEVPAWAVDMPGQAGSEVRSPLMMPMTASLTLGGRYRPVRSGR